MWLTQVWLQAALTLLSFPFSVLQPLGLLSISTVPHSFWSIGLSPRSVFSARNFPWFLTVGHAVTVLLLHLPFYSTLVQSIVLYVLVFFYLASLLSLPSSWYQVIYEKRNFDKWLLYHSAWYKVVMNQIFDELMIEGEIKVAGQTRESNYSWGKK